jgi:hypothetical protein
VQRDEDVPRVDGNLQCAYMCVCIGVQRILFVC